MTDQEFKDFIADEVLLAVKGEMQWEFTKVPEPVAKRYKWFYITAYSYNPAFGVEIPSGETIQKVGGGTATLTAPIFEDSTTMTGTGVTTADYYYDKMEVPQYNPQSVKAYEAILTETLIRLDVSSLSGVPEKKVRDFGRREAWRHIMWATVGDYSYHSPTATFDRAASHQRAREMYAFEENNISQLYPITRFTTEAHTTKNMTIRGVWR